MTIVKKNYYPFTFENTQNLVIFSMKVIFVERELLVPVNLSKSSTENLPTGNFLGHHEELFLSLIVQYIFGGNVYAILELYRQEEAFCRGRIACFGPLNISRLYDNIKPTL